MQDRVDAEEQIQKVVEDTLADKATSTIQARMSAMLLFVKWALQHVPDEQVLPMSEEVAYTYLRMLLENNGPPTRGNSFLQGWNFCVYFIGFDDPFRLATSRRCKGAAHSLYLRKRPLCRKAVLTVVMVMVLELYAFFCLLYTSPSPRDS